MSKPDGYRSDLSSPEAWETLAADPSAQLIDVRTHAEWTFVGLPDLAAVGRTPLLVEWQRYPDMSFNHRFVDELAALLAAAGAGPETPLLFLCRSGARSAAAARLFTQEGHSACCNIADGFEGPPDAEGRRGRVAGWKASGLPWRQG